MSDDLNNRGAQDRARVALDEEHELRYWTKRLGVSEAELRAAVEAVGNSASAVEQHLRR